jgi:nitrite reductase/ring-hydroxylating ferredoxin subunit
MKSCDQKSACVSRREFLVRTGIVGAVTVLTISAPGAMLGSSRFEDVKVPVGADSPLAKVGGSQIVDSPAGKLIVIRRDEHTFAAFSASCTHKGGIVGYDGKEISCPKHGSKFDAKDGSVKGGPAGGPLKSYPAKHGDASVIISV